MWNMENPLLALSSEKTLLKLFLDLGYITTKNLCEKRDLTF